MRKDTIAPKYIPGECNIGPGEITKRIRMGYFGLAGVILLIAGIQLLDLSANTRLLIFFPALFMFSGFLQANQKFCLLYGAFGIFNITEKRERIFDRKQLYKDRIKALKIVMLVAMGSSALALTYFLI